MLPKLARRWPLVLALGTAACASKEMVDARTGDDQNVTSGAVAPSAGTSSERATITAASELHSSHASVGGTASCLGECPRVSGTLTVDRARRRLIVETVDGVESAPGSRIERRIFEAPIVEESVGACGATALVARSREAVELASGRGPSSLEEARRIVVIRVDDHRRADPSCAAKAPTLVTLVTGTGEHGGLVQSTLHATRLSPVSTSTIDCPVAEIGFSQADGCSNDGSIELCIPNADDEVLAEVVSIAPEARCAPGSGRARCDQATQLLCTVPTKGDACSSEHGALTDAAWARVCRLAALEAVTAIVPTLLE